MKKLKYQYRQSLKTYSNGGIRNRYPHLKSLMHKQFSTRQELSFYFLHLIEYKNYPLKLRVARGTGLPHVWDDLPAYVYKVAKSWKHNSKRRHQHYKEYKSLRYVLEDVPDNQNGLEQSVRSLN